MLSFPFACREPLLGGQRGNEQVCYSGQVKYYEVINGRNSSINEEIIGNLAEPRHRAQAFKYLTEKTTTPTERVFLKQPTSSLFNKGHFCQKAPCLNSKQLHNTAFGIHICSLKPLVQMK